MDTKTIPATVYAENNPNPATMKFVANKLIVENNGTVEYTDPDECADSPLATRLFNFPFVTNIFMSSNFITITKNEIIEWDDVVLELREYIQEYLNSGKEVFKKDVTLTSMTSNNVAHEEVEPKTDTEKQIVSILDEYVKPAVERDGGAIHFKSFTDGVVTVVLKGACSGCPSSSVTLKNGVENMMKNMIPEVTEVIAEEE